jgi:ABC-2 type transport system ATP-binding protein
MSPRPSVAVTVSGLGKAYGDTVVLDGIDLDVAAGTIFALLGPNGAGKTTTIKISLRFADNGSLDRAARCLRAGDAR